MKKSFTLLLSTAIAIPLVSCSTTQGPPRTGNTVFHNAEDSPRTGSDVNSRRPRYGAGGVESPTAIDEAEARKRRADARAARNRSINADPDGIVKPYDVASEGGNNYTDSETGTGGEDSNTTEDTPSVADAGSAADAPFAEAVPGEPGFVYSPFVLDRSEAKISIQDDNGVPFPPGQVMKDPITGKLFRVP